jgi:Luciferase-like monooxygenase
MTERLGLAVIPGVGWSAEETQVVAQEAEDAGFDATFAGEVNNDVIATAQVMGAATNRIQVGTWIANIYLRHSYTCAQGAALIGDATDGRFVLGLGVSHRPINAALGIAMSQPLATLRQYAAAVRRWLRGEGSATHLPQRPSPQPVPDLAFHSRSHDPSRTSGTRALRRRNGTCPSGILRLPKPSAHASARLHLPVVPHRGRSKVSEPQRCHAAARPWCDAQVQDQAVERTGFQELPSRIDRARSPGAWFR